MSEEHEEEFASEPFDPDTGSHDVAVGDGLHDEPGETAESDEIPFGMFVLVAIAVMLMVGVGVYLAGTSRRSSSETADAEQRSQEILDATDIDITEFTAPQTTTPSTLPLSDGGEPTVPESASTTTADGQLTVNGDGVDPVVIIDPSTTAVAFVNRTPGDDYGKAGIMTFDGERIITELKCTRIDLNSTSGLCLNKPENPLGSGHGLLLDTQLLSLGKFTVTDPSRAAVSPDGSLVAWTGFTEGHDYGEVGEFSTLTQIINIERGLAVDLEQDFQVIIDGEVDRSIDHNFWGVTFLNNDVFYATLGTSDSMYIVEGSTSRGTVEAKFENASCPEVSPDGLTIVAKEQRGDQFQLVAIDVATGTRRDLGETRSVDDQVEWLDNDSILYAIVNEDEGTEAQPAYDVYVLNTAPGASPRLLIPFADSPAAV